MVKCAFCGADNEPQAAFCGNCGKALVAAPAGPPGPDDTVVPGQTGHDRPAPAGRPAPAPDERPTVPPPPALPPAAAPDPASIICSRCGTANEPTRVYCRKCANELRPPPPPPPSTDERPTRRIPPAAIAGLVVVAGLAAGGLAYALLSGRPAAASPSPPAVAVSPTPSASPSPTPSPTPSAAPTPTPTPTIPPGRQARIRSIALDGSTYVVDYETFEYDPVLPGRHVHFFFNTVSEAKAGFPSKCCWFVYAGPVPFDDWSTSDRPAAATLMCILVANPNHSIVPGTGNCMELPG